MVCFLIAAGRDFIETAGPMISLLAISTPFFKVVYFTSLCDKKHL